MLTFTWVPHSENREVAYRRLRPFGRHSDEKQGVSFLSHSTATDLQNAKKLRVLAAHHGWSVRFFDVSTALVHTPVKDAVLVVPPEDCQGPTHGGV